MYYKNKDWLYQKYVKEKLSINKIAKIYKVGNATIWRWLKKFNITIRFRNETQKGKRGKDSRAWKGGKTMIGGYVYIFQPSHPRALKTGYVAEHHLIMEQKIGRYLYPWEVVHHINGIKTDNRAENLELLPNRGKHNTRVQEIYQENIILKKINIMLLFSLGVKGELREEKLL